MPQLETVIRKYLEAWNDTDAAHRRARIAELFAPDCSYVDPMAAVAGRDGMDALIAGVQQQFPGLRFTLNGNVDAHHDQARFVWHAGPPGASEPAVIGFDVIELEGTRIKRVLGFLDKVPA